MTPPQGTEFPCFYHFLAKKYSKTLSLSYLTFRHRRKKSFVLGVPLRSEERGQTPPPCGKQTFTKYLGPKDAAERLAENPHETMQPWPHPHHAFRAGAHMHLMGPNGRMCACGALS